VLNFFQNFIILWWKICFCVYVSWLTCKLKVLWNKHCEIWQLIPKCKSFEGSLKICRNRFRFHLYVTFTHLKDFIIHLKHGWILRWSRFFVFYIQTNQNWKKIMPKVPYINNIFVFWSIILCKDRALLLPGKYILNDDMKQKLSLFNLLIMFPLKILYKNNFCA